MRKMPTETVYGPIPVGDAAHLSKAIDLLVGGNLTDSEQAFVSKALRHNYTFRVIVDELRERRGMVPVPYDFNWTTI